MSQSTDLQQRYGRAARRSTGGAVRPRWFWPTIAAIGIGIGVAFAAWAGFQDRPISARVWAYDVKDDNNVTITLDLVRPKPLDVRCTVYAQSEDHAIVGEKTVDYPASTVQEQRVAIDVSTERRAVTGVLRTCVERD